MNIKTVLILSLSLLVLSCKDTQNKTIAITESKTQSAKHIVDSLSTRGFEVMSYKDEKTGDTIIMQKYFMAFLNRGANRTQTQQESDSLQALHIEHLERMYAMGYADISGPFGDDGDMRGITIYNVPNRAMADSLATSDPMVKAGRLSIIIKPWWAAKGYGLR